MIHLRSLLILNIYTIMKKFLSFVIFSILACFAANAQDIIVTKDSERIDAKIIEVTDTEVSYKRTDYKEGPTFVLKTSDISSIIYSNGAVQTFASQNEIVRGGGEIKFNPEPITRKRPFGLSVGYVSKQCDNMGLKFPWVYCGYNETKKSTPALRVGLWYAPEFGYGIGLQTGIYYELSHSHYEGPIYDDSGYPLVGLADVSLMEHNLSIPLRIQYRYEIIPDLSVFIYTGPSFDFSVAYDATMTIGTLTEKVSYYSKVEEELGFSFNRYNILWGVGAGIRWKGLQLTLGGDWGLTNLVKGYSGTRLNKPFSISLQYLF